MFYKYSIRKVLRDGNSTPKYEKFENVRPVLGLLLIVLTSFETNLST